jgi:hypothetical protein
LRNFQLNYKLFLAENPSFIFFFSENNLQISPPEGVKKRAASRDLQGWLGFRSFRMRLVLMLWVTFRGTGGHVFKQSYAMAAESQKVPLEIFFNPTILSDDNLFLEFSDFFTPSLF